MANAQKDTIYIDVDDEITTVIDKVRSSKHKIIALVLPKRAAVLQSIVNMKLLKRTTEETKKNVVLITSEASILPLAGAVGFHVARTLQSKPAVPPAPAGADSSVVDTVPEVEGPGPEVDPSRPVGELAAMAADEEAIEVDNDEEEPAAEGLAKEASKKPDKKLKIPNFNKFRLRIILGVAALILLIGGWILATTVLPKANILIKTDTSSYTTELDLVAGTKINQLDVDDKQVPAVSKELKKTDTEKVQATGEKDMGEKASGSVSLKNCTRADGSITVPAGTGVSTGNLTFITQDDVTLPASTFTGGGTCTTNEEEVHVTAQSAGDRFNVGSGRTFTVAGYSGVSGANDDAMSGGTSRIVKVVSQSDIDNAKQKIVDRANDTSINEIKKLMEEDDLIGIEETLSAGTATVTSIPKVTEEASEVTVTSVTTYTMLGIKEDDLKEIVEDEINQKIDKSKQQILDNGLDKAEFKVLEKRPSGEIRLSVRTIAVAGPDLNQDTIKQEIAGKKRGETQSIIQGRPGIRDVEINYSPFWVHSTPTNTSKITIEFQNNDADNQ